MERDEKGWYCCCASIGGALRLGASSRRRHQEQRGSGSSPRASFSSLLFSLATSGLPPRIEIDDGSYGTMYDATRAFCAHYPYSSGVHNNVAGHIAYGQYEPWNHHLISSSWRRAEEIRAGPNSKSVLYCTVRTGTTLDEMKQPPKHEVKKYLLLSPATVNAPAQASELTTAVLSQRFAICPSRARTAFTGVLEEWPTPHEAGFPPDARDGSSFVWRDGCRHSKETICQSADGSVSMPKIHICIYAIEPRPGRAHQGKTTTTNDRVRISKPRKASRTTHRPLSFPFVVTPTVQ